MDGLLLHGLNAELFQLLIENLAQVHYHRFVNLLPQMSAEYLDQGYLQGRNLAVQEYSRQVELDLETNIDVCSIDGRRPPERESTIRNLVETRSLSIR